MSSFYSSLEPVNCPDFYKGLAHAREYLETSEPEAEIFFCKHLRAIFNSLHHSVGLKNQESIDLLRLSWKKLVEASIDPGQILVKHMSTLKMTDKQITKLTNNATA